MESDKKKSKKNKTSEFVSLSTVSISIKDNQTDSSEIDSLENDSKEGTYNDFFKGFLCGLFLNILGIVIVCFCFKFKKTIQGVIHGSIISTLFLVFVFHYKSVISHSEELII